MGLEGVGSAGKELVAGVFLQAEDGIRDLVRSRGLGDVYKRQWYTSPSRMSSIDSGATPARSIAAATTPSASTNSEAPARPPTKARENGVRTAETLIDSRMDLLPLTVRTCLLYTSDPADERSSVNTGG